MEAQCGEAAANGTLDGVGNEHAAGLHCGDDRCERFFRPELRVDLGTESVVVHDIEMFGLERDGFKARPMADNAAVTAEDESRTARVKSVKTACPEVCVDDIKLGVIQGFECAAVRWKLLNAFIVQGGVFTQRKAGAEREIQARTDTNFQ